MVWGWNSNTKIHTKMNSVYLKTPNNTFPLGEMNMEEVLKHIEFFRTYGVNDCVSVVNVKYEINEHSFSEYDGDWNEMSVTNQTKIITITVA